MLQSGFWCFQTCLFDKFQLSRTHFVILSIAAKTNYTASDFHGHYPGDIFVSETTKIRHFGRHGMRVRLIEKSLLLRKKCQKSFRLNTACSWARVECGTGDGKKLLLWNKCQKSFKYDMYSLVHQESPIGAPLPVYCRFGGKRSMCTG